MNGAVAPLFWPADQFAAALASSAERVGLGAPTTEAIDVRYVDVEARLLDSAPAIVRVGMAQLPEYAAVLRTRGRSLWLLAPDLRVHRVDVDVVAERLCLELTTPLAPDIDRLLTNSGVSSARLGAARRAMLRQQLGARPVEGLVRLRPSEDSSVAEELRRAGVVRRLLTFLAAHSAQYGLWILSWWMIGRAALEGRFDGGWFSGWALLLASEILGYRPGRLVDLTAAAIRGRNE
ncbi:MAG: hypothetical protein ABIP94_10985 [Planctomycetota bacterium]